MVKGEDGVDQAQGVGYRSQAGEKLHQGGNNKYVYEYLSNQEIPVNQKMIDLASTLSELHYKTSYFKEIKIDKIKEIYEDIKSNILYIEDYYNKLFDKALSEEYIRPSLYILLINSSASPLSLAAIAIISL